MGGGGGGGVLEVGEVYLSHVIAWGWVVMQDPSEVQATFRL